MAAVINHRHISRDPHTNPAVYPTTRQETKEGPHTKNTDRAAALNKHTHWPDVLLGQGILHSRGEETNPTSEGSRLHRRRKRILRVVILLLVGGVRGHGRERG